VKISRGLSYGLATSAGIVLGLLFLRTAFASEYSLAAEFLSNRLTYIYVFIATAVVFAGLGYVLGRQADELRRLSTIDALTGLCNRRAFSVRLREESRRARQSRAPLALVLIDVDGLKQVNDQRGHEAGDHVLRRTAAAIKNTLRATDSGARWGGDEFAIVAPNTTEVAASRIAERLFLQMGRRARAGDMEATASVGIAVFDPNGPESARPADEYLMRMADAALYRAKSDGRNQVRVA
jgi:diguanylate cyclase (GGDEF)-like protein